MKSRLYKLNYLDLIKGILMAILSAFLSGCYTVFQGGNIPTLEELKKIVMTALASGAAYLIKNFITNSNDELLKPESDQYENQ